MQWKEKRFEYILNKGLIDINDEYKYIINDNRFDYEYGSEKGITGSISYETNGKLIFKFANDITENELKEILKTEKGKEIILDFANENINNTSDIEFNFDEIEVINNILTLTYFGIAPNPEESYLEGF